MRMSSNSGSASLGYNPEGGVAEITAYDKITKQLYVINGNTNEIVVYDFSNPQITPLTTVTVISISGSGSINSIACKNGLLALVYENAGNRQANGFLQLITTTGNTLIGSPIEVGAQPDMVTFTPNGQKILVANEGEANKEFTVDPEGSVSIIDVSSPLSPVSQQVIFTGLNGTIPHLSSFPNPMPSILIGGMINSELTVTSTNIRTPSSVAQDLEPEYITVSPDGNTAWVTCQENNAVIILNVNSATITTIVGLGFKNHNLPGNGLDIGGSANTAAINIRNWPIRGIYMPDAISVETIGGIPYLFTANEGDGRDYRQAGTGQGTSGNRTFRDERDFDASMVTRLSPSFISSIGTTNLPILTASGLRFHASLGASGSVPFLVNTVAGNNVNIGNTYNDIYVYGTRSFSIWNGITGALVWDSGDQIERNVFNALPQNFNADHNGGNNNPRARSARKGPEPEAIVTGMIGDSLYAFVGLERIGGVMAFNVTNPNAPYFRQYINTRNFSVAPNSAAAIDLGPEGLTIIKSDESGDGNTYLVVSNEVSGTLRVFKIDYTQNIQKNALNPFIMPANATETSVQAVSILGTGFESPMFVGVSSNDFLISTHSVSGFGLTLNLTFPGNAINKVIYVKHVAYNPTTPFIQGTLSFADNNSKEATPISLIGIKTLTTPGAAAYTLQLLHASDFEAGLAAMDNAPRFAAIWSQLNGEYPNTLRVSGGDNFLPSPFFNAAADAGLRTTFANIHNGLLGGTNGANYREGIGRGDIAFMNLLDLHASAIGNHEFDAGTGTFSEMISVAFNDNNAPTQIRWAGTRFPYLSCNLDFSADANLSGLFTNEIRPSSSYKIGPTQNEILALTSNQRRKIAPATVVTIGGEVIGIVGATTQIVEKISSTGGVKVIGTTNDDMPLLAAQIQPQVDRLRAMGINKIVLLSHLQQISNEKALAHLLSGVDIIVAAGSHTLMSDADDNLEGDTQMDTYPYATTGIDGGNTLIVSTAAEYSYVGRLVIDFDANGNIIPSSYVTSISGAWKASDAGMARANVNTVTAFSGTNSAYLAKGIVEGINASVAQLNAITLAGVTATLSGIRGIVNAQDGAIFGKTNVFIEGRREQVRLQETNLGNLSADANLAEARKLYPDVMISLKNGGGIRAAIGVVSAVGGNFVLTPPLANLSVGKQFGDISQLDILNSLRFNNSLSVGQISAANMLTVLNHSVAASGPGATPGQFAQVGGIRFSWSPTSVAGTRIRSAAVVNDLGNVIDVIAENGMVVGDPSRLFRIVTLNFMVGTGGAGSVGGDNYPLNTATFLNRIDLSSSVLTNGYNTTTGVATFGSVGGEQDAFAKYMRENYSTTGFNVADTPEAQDLRIQNLSRRSEMILPVMSMPIATLTGVLDSKPTIYAVSISGSRLAQAIQVNAPMGAMVNGMSMTTVPGNGGTINVTAIPQVLGNTTFTITLTSASLVRTFTHTLIGTPRTTTLTGVWTLTGSYLASTPSLKIADFNQSSTTGTIYEGGFSGLHYIKGTNGLEFYTLGDRGPNVEADAANGNVVTKLFPDPSYAPKYHKIKLMPDNTISITSSITFKRPGGTNLSGLVPSNTLGGSGEVAWDINQNVLPGDDWGIDCEGIVEGKDNDLWVCDEYGVNIWRFNKNDGSLINRYSPFGTVVGGNLPLPNDLSKKRANRGFEGVAVTPNGMVYAIIQSPMFNPTSSVQSTSRIHRLVQLDPKTGIVKTFVYVNDGVKANTRVQDWKLGDLVAVNNHEFLVIEHTDRTPYSKNIYKIDISSATALTTTTGFINGPSTGLTLEQLTNAAGLSANSIVPVSKMLITDLQDYGYDQNLGMDKPEGLTIIDENTIAVTNDNDFQVSAPALDGKIVMTDKLCYVHQFKLATPLNYVPVFASPMITFTGSTMTVGGTNIDLTTLLASNSSGAKTFSILSGTAATLSGSTLTAVSVGTITISGMVGTALGFDLGTANAIFTIHPAPNINPSITFTGFSMTVGGANVDLSTIFTSNSTGVKTFSILSGTAATLSGNTLTAVSAGTITITGMVGTSVGFNAGMANAVITVNTVAGIVVVSSLAISPITLLGFIATIDGMSNIQKVSVSGSNLTSNITITAPAGFMISEANSTVSSSVIIVQVAGLGLVEYEVTVMMSTSTVSGTFSGVLNIASSGIERTISVVGIALEKPITSIKNESDATNFTLYPNPVFDGVLYFSTTTSGSIFNLMGIEVMKISNATKIDVSTLHRGTYLVKTTNKQVRKFVIE